jgi:hypothetical protein
MSNHIARALALVIVAATSAAAQQPPRTTESRTVMLSLSEYDRLVDLANRPPEKPSTPPVPAVLASADLRVRVDGGTARGTFTVAGDVLRSGVNRVTLLSGATLIDASLAGRPLPLIADGNAHAALLSGPGPFIVALEWGTPLRYTPGRASFTLPVPPSGTARATIDLPGEQADVRLSAGLITRRTTANGRTLVEATLDPDSPTEVWWSMRDSALVAAAREARTLGDVFTMLTLGESDVRMVALIEVAVVQGEPRTFEVRLPSGYELTGVSGSSLETSEHRDGALLLAVADASARNHQFLLSLERPHDGGSFTLDTAFVSLPTVQRERGEIAVEGAGTLELSAAEREGMHRVDVRELNQALHSLARLPVLSAFRYQRGTAPAAALSLDVKRFADAGVLAAIAERAVATTLVTTEGRALTEVLLTVQNRAQPFLKVTLPHGASIMSVEVAGETAKPVLGADGTRVPLLRPGFRPAGRYTVSFVYLHAGTPFAKKGDLQMTLPRLDIPVGIVEWEVFAPDSYRLTPIDGNMMDRRLHVARESPPPRLPRIAGTARRSPLPGGVRGLLQGRAVDADGAPLPGVTITLADANGATQTVVSDEKGVFNFRNVLQGEKRLVAALAGFATVEDAFYYDQSQQVEIRMEAGALSETVTVSADSPKVSTQVSQNVVNLQRRAAGVLPVRVDVPKAGTSHQFIKPLVVDQEATISFHYKRR